MVAFMKRRFFVLAVFAIYAVTLAAFWFSAVRTLVVFPDKHNYAWQVNPLANNGYSDNFEIASYDKPPYNMRGWIHFNISLIPSDAWVITATFRLRLWHKTTVDPAQNMGDPTGRTYGAYRLTQPWIQSQANWANQPNYTDLHHARSQVPAEQGGWNGPLVWMDWNIRDIMNDWRSNATSNCGLVVKDMQEYASVFYSTQFFTNDQVPNSTYYPRLIVTYVLPWALLALGIVLAVETALFRRRTLKPQIAIAETYLSMRKRMRQKVSSGKSTANRCVKCGTDLPRGFQVLRQLRN
jgi:hypothetical protein